MRLFLLNNFDGRMTVSGFGYPVVVRSINRLMDVEMLAGCNMVVRRSIMERERFDEWFTGYSYREDADLTYRISRLTRVVMIPQAKLYHHQSPASRISSVDKKRMQMRNYAYMFRKYKDHGWRSRLLFAYSVLGLLVIDLLEFLSHRDRERLEVLSTSLRAVFSLGPRRIKDKG